MTNPDPFCFCCQQYTPTGACPQCLHQHLYNITVSREVIEQIWGHDGIVLYDLAIQDRPRNRSPRSRLTTDDNPGDESTLDHPMPSLRRTHDGRPAHRP